MSSPLYSPLQLYTILRESLQLLLSLQLHAHCGPQALFNANLYRSARTVMDSVGEWSIETVLEFARKEFGEEVFQKFNSMYQMCVFLSLCI